MRTVIRVLLAGTLSLSASLAPAQVLFACEPEWAALARVLMPQAQIHVATSVMQDPHHIEARPALIAQLRSADMALCTGAGLEEGWLPVLQQRSGNPRIQNGQPSLFWATEGQNLLRPTTSSGGLFQGDVHPEGNPHLHAHPHRLLMVAQAMAVRMARLWPQQAADIEARRRGFELRWQSHMTQWRVRTEGLRGRSVVSQHTHFAYLWEWLSVQQVADLEPKPGLSPTPAHLQPLVQGLRSLNPPVLGLVVASHQDPRAARWVGQQLPGLPVWVWPATVSQISEEGLVQWFEIMLNDLRVTPP